MEKFANTWYNINEFKSGHSDDYPFDFAIFDRSREIWIQLVAPDEYSFHSWETALTKLCPVENQQQGRSILNETTAETISFVNVSASCCFCML